MEDKDKIYGLIVQAQEMQKFALEYHAKANNTLKALPGTVRDAVTAAAIESIKDGTKKASEDLSAASSDIKTVSAKVNAVAGRLEKVDESMQGAWVLHVVLLVAVGVIISLGIYVLMGLWLRSQAEYLSELKDEAATMRNTIRELKTDLGKAQITTCGSAHRSCIRVDERPGTFEGQNGEKYMVIFGY
jgi:hypothetical protein